MVVSHIKRELEKAGGDVASNIPRKTALADLDRAVALSPEQNKELIYVRGLEGNGRRTAVRQFMQLSFPHLTERPLALDSVDTPHDMLLRMLEASGATKDRVTDTLTRATDGSSSYSREIRKIIHQARSNQSYYVIAVDKFTALDAVFLPEWLPTILEPFKEGAGPLAFVVTSNVLSEQFLRKEPRPTVVEIGSLDESEAAMLLARLIERDPSPSRWTPEAREKVIYASHSSPALCKQIMRALSREHTLDFLDEIVEREAAAYGSSVSTLARHFINTIQERKHILVLRLIDRLGMVSRMALEQMLEGSPNATGGTDLYLLRQMGLLEQMSPDVFRIPPLLQRRLGDALWVKDVDAEVESLIARFGERVPLATDEYGPIYAVNLQAARLRSKGETVPGLDLFLTISLLLKTGLERYSKGAYAVAHKTLLLAMRRIEKAPDSVDLDSQVEIARYFGLAAAYEKEYGDTLIACRFLETRFANTNREAQAMAMAEFLRGFELRLKPEYDAAIPHFENAKAMLRGIKHADRQRGAVLTELSRALLYKHPPAYDRAVTAAEEAYGAKDVTMNLDGLIRAKIRRAFSTSFRATAAFDTELIEIRKLLKVLTAKSMSSGHDFHLMREAELERQLAFDKTGPITLTKAILLVDQAIGVSRRDEPMIEMWALRLFDQANDHSQLLVQQTTDVLAHKARYSEKVQSAALKTLIVVKSKAQWIEATMLLDRNKQLLAQRWSAKYLDEIIKAKGAIKRDRDGFMKFLRA